MENHQILFNLSSSTQTPTTQEFMNGNHERSLHETMKWALKGEEKRSGTGGGASTSSNNLGRKKVRKPKFAFQTRSQVDILDDGYRWRKYGQKAVKNNKFPRSYYRCTYQGCNVKKQVQRHNKDEGIVVTTYEGVHTHHIEKQTDNFEQILKQLQIYPNY